jgi:hypothetical protein
LIHDEIAWRVLKQVVQGLRVIFGVHIAGESGFAVEKRADMFAILVRNQYMPG